MVRMSSESSISDAEIVDDVLDTEEVSSGMDGTVLETAKDAASVFSSVEALSEDDPEPLATTKIDDEIYESFEDIISSYSEVDLEDFYSKCLSLEEEGDESEIKEFERTQGIKLASAIGAIENHMDIIYTKSHEKSSTEEVGDVFYVTKEKWSFSKIKNIFTKKKEKIKPKVVSKLNSIRKGITKVSSSINKNGIWKMIKGIFKKEEDKNKISSEEYINSIINVINGVSSIEDLDNWCNINEIYLGHSYPEIDDAVQNKYDELGLTSGGIGADPKYPTGVKTEKTTKTTLKTEELVTPSISEINPEKDLNIDAIIDYILNNINSLDELEKWGNENSEYLDGDYPDIIDAFEKKIQELEEDKEKLEEYAWQINELKDQLNHLKTEEEVDEFVNGLEPGLHRELLDDIILKTKEVKKSMKNNDIIEESDLLKFDEIDYIETAKGSKYHYLEDGRTQRFKKVENSLKDPCDYLVFIPSFEDLVKRNSLEKLEKNGISSQNDLEKKILSYIFSGSEKEVYLLDSNKKVVLSNLDINKIHEQGEKINLVFFTGNNADFSIEVSNIPKMGYSTFDYRKYKDEKTGDWYSSRHLGNRVVNIVKKASIVKIKKYDKDTNISNATEELNALMGGDDDVDHNVKSEIEKHDNEVNEEKVIDEIEDQRIYISVLMAELYEIKTAEGIDEWEQKIRTLEDDMLLSTKNANTLGVALANRRKKFSQSKESLHKSIKEEQDSKKSDIIKNGNDVNEVSNITAQSDPRTNLEDDKVKEFSSDNHENTNNLDNYSIDGILNNEKLIINRNNLAEELSKSRYFHLGVPAGEINFHGEKKISIERDFYQEIFKEYDKALNIENELERSNMLSQIDTKFAEILILDNDGIIELTSKSDADKLMAGLRTIGKYKSLELRVIKKNKLFHISLPNGK